jgi:hypothetical protein
MFGIWNNCLTSRRGLLFYQFKRREMKLTLVIIKAYQCFQLHKKLHSVSFLKDKSIHKEKYWGAAV